MSHSLSSLLLFGERLQVQSIKCHTALAPFFSLVNDYKFNQSNVAQPWRPSSLENNYQQPMPLGKKMMIRTRFEEKNEKMKKNSRLALQILLKAGNQICNLTTEVYKREHNILSRNFPSPSCNLTEN